MNVRRISMVFLAAFLVSGLATWLLSRRSGAHAAERLPVAQIVVAADTLQAGDVLKAASTKLVDWPASNPVAGTFTRPEPLMGRVVLYPLERDQPITEKFLSSPGSGLGLAGTIPEGMRAIALRSDEVMGVAGFLVPGSHVDMLVTYRTDHAPEPITLTVLQNVQVLAAGQKNQPDPDGKPITATVVTLLLNPDDAQRAVLASTQGAIHFILRNGADKEQPRELPMALSRLSGIDPEPVPTVHAVRLPGAKPVSPSRQIVVETIAGDKHTTESFGGPW